MKLDDTTVETAFEVTQYDGDGNVLDEQVIDGNSASIKFEDVRTNAVLHGVETVEVRLVELEAREGDTTVFEMEQK